ncbi:unnamed protein product [Alopecurus aequalis]
MDALVLRPATPDDAGGGGNRSQAFLRAFEQMVSNGSKTRCWATQHGWLLLVDPVSLHAMLWDPESQVRVDLPRLADDLPKNCKCLLSHEKATSHGCVLLVVDADRPVIRYCRVDPYTHHPRWYAHEYSFEGRPGFQVRSVAAALGDFYFPLSPTELVCMELMCYEFSPAPRFTTVEHQQVYLDPELPWDKAPRHLVGSADGEELLMVVQRCLSPYDGTYRRQNVYRMDFLNRRWTDVSRLRDRVLLLGPSHFSASFSASELGLEDSCVYIVTPEMPMCVHDLKSPFYQRFHLRPADPVLSRMYTLAANACG